MRLEAQDKAFEEMQRKHQEELEAVKKSQQEKNEAWGKKQHDIGFSLKGSSNSARIHRLVYCRVKLESMLFIIVISIWRMIWLRV